MQQNTQTIPSESALYRSLTREFKNDSGGQWESDGWLVTAAWINYRWEIDLYSPKSDFHPRVEERTTDDEDAANIIHQMLLTKAAY